MTNMKLGLRGKINLLVVGVGIICSLTIAIISSYKSSESLEKLATSQLKSSSIMMKDNVESYFESLENFTKKLSKDRLIEGLFIAFEGAYYGGAYPDEKDNNILSSSYLTNDKIYGDRVRNVSKDFGIKNIILASLTGPIVMVSSMDKKAHLLGRHLLSGELKDSNLSKCFKNAAESDGSKTFYSDFEVISTTGKVSAFLCQKKIAEFDYENDGIFKGDDLGVVISEIDINKVNQITTISNNDSETEQYFMVAKDGTLKSNLKVEKDIYNLENFLKNKMTVQSDAITSALEKQSGVYKGKSINGYEVLSYYSYIEIFGKTWAFIGEKSTDEVYAPVRTMIYFIIIITLIIIASTIVISFYLTKKLAEPITISTETLRTVSSEVSEKSNDIKSAASNLNDYSSELSSSVQETVSTLDELTSMVSKNLENVARSSESSKNSKQAAEQGLETIKNLLTAFNDMTESNKVIVNDMETTTQQMIEITSVINEIAQKTDMINDIVFQTKLLAFNASVEAARAGEHGKGFSVVAEEVGSLANASGNAAKEITEMVTDSVAKVNTIVDQTKKRIEVSTKEGKDKLNIGYEIAKQCGDKLQDILNNVNQVNTSINEVRVASDEQSSGITEVSKAMSSLDNVSNQTENMARELLNSSNNMNLRSVDLSGIVTELDSLLDGDDTKKKETTHKVQKIAQVNNVSSLDERRKA